MKAIKRIYQYIDSKGIKAVPFEKKIGLSNGYLGKQLSRNADLGEGILMRVIENCPDINPEWLLTGNGRMLKNEEDNEFSDKEIMSKEKGPEGEVDYKKLWENSQYTISLQKEKIELLEQTIEARKESFFRQNVVKSASELMEDKRK